MYVIEKVVLKAEGCMKASQHHQSYCEPGVEYSTQGPKTRILVLVMDDDGWWVDGWMDGWWMDGW